MFSSAPGMALMAWCGLVAAGDVAKTPDPDLPQPLDLKVASSLLEKPPFTREINLSDTLALTGVAYVEGKPVATLTDKRTKKSILITTEPNEKGWKLAEASAPGGLKSTEIKIYVGGEMVTVHYGDAQLAPKGGEAARWSSLTEKDLIRTDENGKQYVRGSIYLNDQDREKYYRGWSRESHDKYRKIIQDHREKMFQWSHEERAAFSKKVFDAVDREEQSRPKK